MRGGSRLFSMASKLNFKGKTEPKSKKESTLISFEDFSSDLFKFLVRKTIGGFVRSYVAGQLMEFQDRNRRVTDSEIRVTIAEDKQGFYPSAEVERGFNDSLHF